MSIITGLRLNPRQKWRLGSLWPMLFAFVAALYLAPDTRSMRNTYYLAVLLPGLVLLRREDLRLLWQNPVLRAALLLLGYLWLSCLWSTPSSVAQVAKASAQLVYLLVFLLVATRCLESTTRRRQLLIVWVSAAVLGALLSLWHFWGIWPEQVTEYWLWTRRMTFWGIADHPIIGACLYAPAVICAYVASLNCQGWRRLLWLLCGLLLVLLILRTYSRGPLIATVGTLLVGVILSRERKIAVLLGLVIVAGVALLGYQDPGSMLARGTGVRPQIWLNVWHAVLRAPLFGHGLLSEESINLTGAGSGPLVIDHPHSIFMATLFYGGLVGMALLLSLLATGLKEGFRTFRGGQNEVLLLLLLAVALGVTDNNKLLLSPSPIWLFYWLPFVFAATAQRMGHK